MVRTDRNIHEDVGLRGSVIQLLHSYSTAWLKIGLETVLGCEIVRPSNMSANTTDEQVRTESLTASAIVVLGVACSWFDSSLQVLSKFMHHNLLRNTALTAQHERLNAATGDRPVEWQFEQSKFSLKKILLVRSSPSAL